MIAPMSDATESGIDDDAGLARTPAVAADYQRRRLWIGIGGIGSILVLQWIGVAACFPAWVDQTAGDSAWFGGSLGGVVMAAILATLAVLVQLPFDLLGRRVEARFGQWRRADARAITGDWCRGQSWWRRWWSSAWRWVAAATMGGLVIGIAWETDSTSWLPWTILGLALLSGVAVTLPIRPGEAADPDVDRSGATDAPRDAETADTAAAAETDAAAWASETRQHIVRLGLAWPRISWYDHGERSLAGGWHGLGPWARLWLSTSMLDVPPPLAAGLIVRELGHADRGDRAFGVLASAAWIAAGMVGAWGLAESLLGAGRVTPAGLVVVIAVVMSTWSWLGLFVWPALGRRQVLAADAFMLRAGMTRDEAVAVLDELSRRNRPDETLPAAVAFVFHPIPPMERRRRALRGDDQSLRTADDAPTETS